MWTIIATFLLILSWVAAFLGGFHYAAYLVGNNLDLFNKLIHKDKPKVIKSSIIPCELCSKPTPLDQIVVPTFGQFKVLCRDCYSKVLTQAVDQINKWKIGE